jgi:hypothetical protein
MIDLNPGFPDLRNEARPSMIEDQGFVRTEPPKSPLDPFLCQFLWSVKALPNGYHPSSDRHALTAALGWPADFVDAILTSAQARGMVERVPVTRNRRRTIWRLSSRGQSWLEMAEVTGQMPLNPDHGHCPPAPSV